MLAMVIAGPGAVLWLSAAAVAALMLAVWATSVALEDASIVDVAWGPALALVALVAALAGGGDATRRWLLLGLTCVWGGRLALHIATRKLRERGEDRRYAQMRSRHPTGFALWSLVAVFALQGAVALIVSLPLQVSARRGGVPVGDYVPGLALFAAGLVFEVLGDEQLRRFRADRTNVGRVMDRGLWRYTRHPNYFGDACVWWGLWLIVAPSDGAWWTFVGPLLMTVLLVRVSGKGLLERDIGDRRPGYADYVRRTSGFVPLPPREEAR
ncbi:MAG: DUF1295 domain-containing protein [Solirubrobacteraceae bacterium]